MEVRIGCSGWSYTDWIGKFYPPGKNFFDVYSSHFDTVEINNTFYKFPSNEVVQTWYDQAPKNFKYTLKASRYITHMKKFNDVDDALKKLYSLSKILKEKMGCFLFQMAPNYNYTDEKLQKIVKYLDASYKNAVEFRHPSWWNKTVFDSFKEHGIMFAATDGFGMPEDFQGVNDEYYIRMHGNAYYSRNYQKKELVKWVSRIEAKQPKVLWVYFNNDVNAYAPYNAIDLRNMLKTKETIKKLPISLKEVKSEQRNSPKSRKKLKIN